MPRAVVILPSTTYRAGDFIAAAESLGVDLVVASEQPAPFDMGDRYVQLDCSDPEEAAESLASLGDEVPLDGVVAADDAGVVIAAITGTNLGLAANDRAAAAATKNKLEMRRRLAASEVPQPAFAELAPGEDPAGVAGSLEFPIVVKPVDRSASQGVIRVDDADAVDDAVQRIREIIGSGDSGSPLIAETFLPGLEVAVEGIVRDGELTVLALFDKPDTPSGPTFPETILVTPSRLPGEIQAECRRVAQAAIRGLGLTHGPVHVELKVNGQKVDVIEVAARSIGGLCSRSLSFGLMGTTLETLILRNALGMDKPELKRERHASGVLMIPIPAPGTLREVRGIDETGAIDGVTGIDITIHTGTVVHALPEGDRYLGFVFARADSPDDVETILRKASSTLEPIID
jgi:biotin carboxylase